MDQTLLPIRDPLSITTIQAKTSAGVTIKDSGGVTIATLAAAGDTDLVVAGTHAASSAGFHIHNASGQDTAIFGAGGGQGSTFYGQINGTALVLSGAASCTTLTATSTTASTSTTDGCATFGGGIGVAGAGYFGGLLAILASGQATVWNGATGTYCTWQYNGTPIGDIGTADEVIGGGSSGDFGISSRAGSIRFGLNGTLGMTLATGGALTTVGGITCTTLTVDAADYTYWGPSGTDGTWRMGRSGDNFVIQRRESGSYVTKQTIAA